MVNETIVITGTTGFLGSHVVEHFLNAGYHVKALCRISKADELSKRSDDPKFSVKVIESLAEDDFTSILQGWGTVPEAFRTESKKYINEFLPPKNSKPLTPQSSQPKENLFNWLYTMSRDLLYSLYFRRSMSTKKLGLSPDSHKADLHNDTGRIEVDKINISNPEEPPKDMDPFAVYAASKLLAEEAVWSFADAYSDVDMITILPAYFYGPFSKFHIIREPTTLSTNYLLYSLFSRPRAVYPPELIPDHVVDVRDVAKCCVLAMSTPKPESPTIPHRRILLCSGAFSWRDVATEIAQSHPGIKDRVVVDQEADSAKRPAARVDVSMAHQVLGWNEFTHWKVFVKDAVASLLETEKQWNPEA
ncbi:hypothetical protein Clacol_008802 [Clathrus columnatus]|uniref:NAD-dependent epimerase/dehydratase domain-containing protein n=1 Tax=Clathrus columnatus TaxID=1419009 RepID=A0AAV5AIQ9_9AGAM|nr:hypothetical protein Clacol_008802 [Clathrus columnatus]